MGKGNKAQTVKSEAKAVVVAPANQFSYACPSCGKVAIETSNKMLGVNVNCASCGVEVRLDDEGRYTELNDKNDQGVGEDTPPTGNNVDAQ